LREIYEEAAGKKLFGLDTSLSDEQRDDRQLEGFIAKVKTFSSSLLLPSPELSDTKVYAP